MNPAISTRIAPFVLFSIFLSLEQGLRTIGVGDRLDLRWLYPIKAVCVAIVLSWLFRRYEELKSPGFSSRGVLASVLTGLTIFLVWIQLDGTWFVVGAHSEYSPLDTEGAIDWRLAGFRLFGAVAVVPFMEELFWRAFFMRWLQSREFAVLRPAAIKWSTLLICSIAFGFSHHLWFAGILAGLAYGWLYMRTENLWTAIIAHGVTNLALGLWVLHTEMWQFW